MATFPYNPNSNVASQLQFNPNIANAPVAGQGMPIQANPQFAGLANVGINQSPQISGGANGGIQIPQTPSLAGTIPTQALAQMSQGYGQMPSLTGGANGGYQPPAQNLNLAGTNPTHYASQLQMPQQLMSQSVQGGGQNFAGGNINQMPSIPSFNPNIGSSPPNSLPQGFNPTGNINAMPSIAPFQPNIGQPPATQSVEQQALGGGSNPQQVQNFMQALQGVGAGTNNTFQNAPANNPQTQTAAPLYPGGAQPSNASSNNNVQGYYNPQSQQMQNSSYGQSPPAPQQGSYAPGITPPNPNINNPQTQQLSPYANAASQVPLNGGSGQIGQGGANGGFRAPVAPAPNLGGVTQPVAGLGGNLQAQNTQQKPTAPTLPGQNNMSSSLVSDKRAKENIGQVKSLNSFLSNLTANSYTYKNPEHGQGTFVSPMAQDLEKSKLGKTMVETRPDGLKQVNYARGFGVMMAAEALMHQRLSKIESKLKIKGK